MWDWELDRLDYHFIDGIDPEYFGHVALTELGISKVRIANARRFLG